MTHPPEQGELMDLTEFMHGGAGRLVTCRHCGLVVRQERNAADYASDSYDRDILDELYPRYRDAFQDKRENYRDLLRPHAEVLELGSHLGAFLEAAESWNWNATGLDIGKDTSAYAQSRGFRVIRDSLDTRAVPTHSMDALFIWNCFEQLEKPGEILRQAHQVLARNGIVVVRTPNLGFYEHARRQWRQGSAEARQQLAYHNLLGFPYFTGYTPETLTAVLRKHGFQPVAGFDSTLITLPLIEPTTQTAAEMKRSQRVVDHHQRREPRRLSGPWIEMVCRAGG